jgi:hypothetical protein
LRLLRRPSTLARIGAVMVKHYAHYRKKFGLKPVDISAPRLDQSKQGFIAELRKMELRAQKEGYAFGGNPVLYETDKRDRREKERKN